MKQRKHNKKINKTQNDTVYRHEKTYKKHTNKTRTNENKKITNTYTKENTAHI